MKKSSAEKYLSSDQVQEPDKSNTAERTENLISLFRPSVADMHSGPPEVPDELKELIYNYLYNCLCLEKGDEMLPELIYQIASQLPVDLPSEELELRHFNEAILRDTEKNGILHIAIQKWLIAKKRVDLSKVREEKASIVIEDARILITKNISNENFDLDKALETNSTVIDLASDEDIVSREVRDDILNEREDAVDYMESKYGDVLDRWVENEHALSDAVMAHFYSRNDQKGIDPDNLGNHFLTTYFDGAQYGLSNKLFEKAIIAIAEGKLSYPEFMAKYKTAILTHLEPRIYAEGESKLRGHSPLPNRFVPNPTGELLIPENIFFASNGTSAFQLLCDSNFIKEGETVLVTKEEYGELNDVLKNQSVNVVELECAYTDDDSFEREVRRKFESNNINHALVSALSRHGNLFPLEVFDRARNDFSSDEHRANLIADYAQIFGAGTIDLRRGNVDVAIASIQKGSDVREPQGVLVIANDLLSRIEPKGLKKMDAKGTENLIAVARTFVACHPELLGTFKFDDEDKAFFEKENIGHEEQRKILQKMAISVPKREEAIKQLAYKFARLVHAINERNGNKIEFFNHQHIYADTGINEDKLSRIFECRIKGVTLDQIRRSKEELAEWGISVTHGVTINNYWCPWEDGVSFRIAIHPFMGNDSLKVLGRVLAEACGEKSE